MRCFIFVFLIKNKIHTDAQHTHTHTRTHTHTHAHTRTHTHTHNKTKIHRIRAESATHDDIVEITTYKEEKSKNEIARIVYTPYNYNLNEKRLFEYIRGHPEWKEKYPIIWNLSMFNCHIYCIQFLPYIADFIHFIYQTYSIFCVFFCFQLQKQTKKSEKNKNKTKCCVCICVCVCMCVSVTSRK